MIEQRLLAAGGLPVAAKLVAALAVACLVLAALLGLSVWGNWHLFQSGAKVAANLGAKLAASEAKGAAELASCAGTNANVVATVHALGDELHACRGSEQKIDEARRLALRQRERARQTADGEAQMRREAIEAIVRRDENCSRPVCRALSDELLSPPADPDAQ